MEAQLRPTQLAQCKLSTLAGCSKVEILTGTSNRKNVANAEKGGREMARSKGPSAPSKAKMPSRASKVASRHTPTNARVRSGAGLTSNKLKRVGVSYGRSSTNKVSPSAADQLGQHLTKPKQAQPLYTGIGPQVDSGNLLAAKTDCRPGGSRTIYARGTNQVHGP